MGYSDLGCMGSEIKTPNIDALAKNGLLLTHFYNNAKCCPTRASLLTGLYSHEAGIGLMTEDKGFPSYQGYLNDSSITLAEVLKTAGYTTGLSGKWHVGEAKEHWPLQRGFDYFYGVPQGGGVYYYPFLIKRELWLNNSQLIPKEGYYSTEAFNEHAVEFIDAQKNSDKPFFLYVAHIAPHFPLQALPKDIKMYRGKYKRGFEKIREARLKRQRKKGIIDKDLSPSEIEKSSLKWDSFSASEKDSLDLTMSVYAAQITCMDRGIGDIIKKLKDIKQFDNTLILFLSDNGATKEKAFRIKTATGKVGTANSWQSYGLNWANVSNTPYKRYKTFMAEGGILTPLVASYPNLIKHKSIDKQSVGSVRDIMPTVLDLAGIEYPKTFKGKNLKALNGKSLLSIFEGNISNNRLMFWEHIGNRGARDGDWKIVSEFPADKWELYNLATDPTELHDLAAENPAKVAHLESLYQDWAKRSGVLPWRIVNKKH